MVVKYLPDGAENVIEYEVRKNNLDLGDGEMIINLAKKERDDPVHIDICFDMYGGLIMGTGDAQKYVAQVDIPARAYEEVESEDEEGGTVAMPLPFDIKKCTLTLWELEV